MNKTQHRKYRSYVFASRSIYFTLSLFNLNCWSSWADWVAFSFALQKSRYLETSDAKSVLIAPLHILFHYLRVK